jgi:hypothetical protein
VKLKIYIHIIFLVFGIGTLIQAQSKIDTLPSVFLIGEYESSYNKMLSNQPDLLMSVCDDNMDIAYKNWLDFLVEIEKYAISQDVNINGVKMWINVFWNEDGTVKHIAYYPKPNSINMDYEYISVLFRNFIRTYHSDLRNDKLFCHYGSASFPSFIISTTKQDK